MSSSIISNTILVPPPSILKYIMPIGKQGKKSRRNFNFLVRLKEATHLKSTPDVSDAGKLIKLFYYIESSVLPNVPSVILIDNSHCEINSVI